MDIKFKPTSEIIADLGLNPDGRIQRFFQNTCYKAMDKYVPMDKGDLRTTVDLSNPEYIVYEMPYARYQYYGVRADGTHKINPENYTTPGTGTYWDINMWNIEGQKIVEAVQKEINRGG